MCKLISKIPLMEKAIFAFGLWAATGKEMPQLSIMQESVGAVGKREILILKALEKRLLPFVFNFAKAHGWKAIDEIRSLYEIFCIACNSLCQDVSQVLERMDNEGIPIMLIDGCDIMFSIYPPDLPRIIDNVDLLVRPPDIANLVRVFSSEGYVQGKPDLKRLQVTQLSKHEGANYEAQQCKLVSFCKIIKMPLLSKYVTIIEKYNRLLPFTAVDADIYGVWKYNVHFNFAPEFKQSDVWCNPRRIKIPLTGQQVLAQSVTDVVWFQAVKLYHETTALNQPCIRRFIDALIVLHKFHWLIDWARVIAVAQRYDLQSPLYYVFSHANELLGTVVPKEVMDFCDPTQEVVNRTNDWGDFLPKLLGGVVVNRVITVDREVQE